MAALAQKSKHVPYRNSKLTHFLQDSLGGDSKTIMIVAISPAAESAQETQCSLTFAERVRKVELGPAKKATSNQYTSAVTATAQQQKLLAAKDSKIFQLMQELKAAKTKLRVISQQKEPGLAGTASRRPGNIRKHVQKKKPAPLRPVGRLAPVEASHLGMAAQASHLQAYQASRPSQVPPGPYASLALGAGAMPQFEHQYAGAMHHDAMGTRGHSMSQLPPAQFSRLPSAARQ